MLLNKELIQRLLSVMYRQFGYPMNVMDEKAVIVASTDITRVGDFHQGAYEIIHKKKNVHALEESYSGDLIGVRPGITFPLYVQDHLVGAFGVTGDPEKCSEIAKVLKLAFETMLEYEMLKTHKKTVSEPDLAFVNELLMEYPMNLNQIKSTANSLGVDMTIPRLPIMIHFGNGTAYHQLMPALRRLQQNPRFQRDLLFVAFENTIVAFCSIPDDRTDEREPLKRFFLRTADELRNAIYRGDESLCGSDYMTLCGIPVTAIADYRVAYDHMWWLTSRADARSGERYYRYMIDYLAESVFDNTCNADVTYILRYYYGLLNAGGDADESLRLITHWLKNGINFNACAKSAFLHKNTVLQRFKKIESALEMDNLRDINSIILLYMLVKYGQNRQSVPIYNPER